MRCLGYIDHSVNGDLKLSLLGLHCLGAPHTMSHVITTPLCLQGSFIKVQFMLDGMCLGIDTVSPLTLAILTGCWDEPSTMLGKAYCREVA